MRNSHNHRGTMKSRWLFEILRMIKNKTEEYLNRITEIDVHMCVADAFDVARLFVRIMWSIPIIIIKWYVFLAFGLICNAIDVIFRRFIVPRPQRNRHRTICCDAYPWFRNKMKATTIMDTYTCMGTWFTYPTPSPYMETCPLLE